MYQKPKSLKECHFSLQNEFFTAFVSCLTIILLIVKLHECTYQTTAIQEARWSQLQNIKREVNTVPQCGALCFKNEECRTFHFEKETRLCTLAIADVWDLANIQIRMCSPQAQQPTKIKVFAESEGKILTTIFQNIIISQLLGSALPVSLVDIYNSVFPRITSWKSCHISGVSISYILNSSLTILLTMTALLSFTSLLEEMIKPMETEHQQSFIVMA